MTPSPLPARADVVVIGAGLAGAATAHGLARAGVRALVLERHGQPGLEASGRNAAMIRESAEAPALRALASRGAALHRSGELAPFRRTGAFLIGEGGDEAARHVPLASGRGRFWPDDGVVDSAALLARFLAGADLRVGVEVRALSPGAHGLAVETSQGVVVASAVVNAAGAWAGRLGGLPLAPLKRHLFPLVREDAQAAWPIAWDLEAALYFRPEGRGLLACACDETPAEPGDNEVLPTALAALQDKAERFQPGLLPLRPREGWAGQRTFAPDRLPVVGWDPRVAGLFWVAGLGGAGVTLSPAVGELAARLLLSGRGAAVPGASAFSPARLA